MRVELPWSKIDEWIRDYLSRNGIDISRAYAEHALWNGQLILVYTQDQEQLATPVQSTQRPSYLQNWKGKEE